MTDRDPSTQERLQTQALTNVRALLDKLEKERSGPSLPTLIAGVAVTLLLFVAITAYFVVQGRHKMASAEPSRPTEEMTEAEYAGYVRDRVQRFAGSQRKRYEGLRGSAVVEIRIGVTGIADPVVTKSSGDSVSDDRFKSMVVFGGPYGSPPNAQAGKVFVARVALRVNPDGDGPFVSVDPAP